MTDVFIGRQPVLDRDLAVWGYELLFRSGQDNRAHFSDAGQATSQVILNALVEFGLERVVGDSMALINLPRDFLIAEHTDLLPPAQVVLEVLEDVVIDDDLLGGVRRLRETGYTIALDDFAFEPRWAPLVELADVIKVEVPAISPQMRAQLGPRIGELRRRGVRLLAEKVETQEEFEAYRKLGFDYFQGYFFSRPKLMQGSRIPGSRLQTLRLVTQLNQDDVDLARLESLVSASVDLSYKIMRLLNSSRFALRRKVESVHQAIVLLGTRQLRSLATMVALSGIDDKPSELVMLSLVRARLCEQLSRLEGSQGADGAFTVGMLSTLDALLDRPIEELLAELPLADDVRAALLERTGPAGLCLEAALACEQADTGRLAALGLDPARVAELYVESLDWARDTLATLDG